MIGVGQYIYIQYIYVYIYIHVYSIFINILSKRLTFSHPESWMIFLFMTSG